MLSRCIKYLDKSCFFVFMLFLSCLFFMALKACKKKKSIIFFCFFIKVSWKNFFFFFFCFLWIKVACLFFMLSKRIKYLDKSCLFVFYAFFCMWDFVVKKIKSPQNLIYTTTCLTFHYFNIVLFHVALY